MEGDLNRHFTKQDVHMANKYTKRHRILLLTKETQIEAEM